MALAGKAMYRYLHVHTCAVHASKTVDTLRPLGAKMVSVLEESDITALSSQASGFHHLELNRGFRAEEQPALGRWFEADGNGACVECGERIELKDAWASVTLAASLCRSCAGRHRGLGRHLSAVKSLSLDVWTTEELNRLRLGGNARLRSALGKVQDQPPSATCVQPTLEELQKVYSSAEARAFREWLDREARGGGSSASASGDRSPQARSYTDTGILPSTCTQETATSSRSHANALAQRPGYFRTEHGFGYLGTESRSLPVMKTQSLSFVASLAKAAVQRCLPAPRELPSLGMVDVAEFLGVEAPSIFRCAEQGDAAGVEALVQDGSASMHDVDELGWTPLFYAAKFGHEKVCNVLLCLASSRLNLVNVRETSGMRWTPLHYAAEMGRAGCVYLLLQAGASPDGLADGRRTRTPLRLAAFNGHADAVDLLLGFGADPKLLPSEGYPIYARFDQFRAGYVESCLARFSWQRVRRVYLIRDKAEISSGPSHALVKLLGRQTVFFCVAKHL